MKSEPFKNICKEFVKGLGPLSDDRDNDIRRYCSAATVCILGGALIGYLCGNWVRGEQIGIYIGVYSKPLITAAIYAYRYGKVLISSLIDMY